MKVIQGDSWRVRVGRGIRRLSEGPFRWVAPVLYPVVVGAELVVARTLDRKGHPLPSAEERAELTSRVTMIVKTFERPQTVQRLVRTARTVFSGRIIVADDSREPLTDLGPGVEIIALPFNVGLSAGRNAALDQVDTEFVFVSDDDTVFTRASDIVAMMEYLDAHPEVDLIAPQLVNLPYVYAVDNRHQSLYPGAESPLRQLGEDVGGAMVVYKVENVFLARTAAVKVIRWDDDLRLVEHKTSSLAPSAGWCASRRRGCGPTTCGRPTTASTCNIGGMSRPPSPSRIASGQSTGAGTPPQAPTPGRRRALDCVSPSNLHQGCGRISSSRRSWRTLAVVRSYPVNVQLLLEVARAFDEADVAYVVAGGVAVVLHGHTRMTVDLDVAMDLRRDNLEAGLAALTELGLAPRLPVSASDFADPSHRESWVRDRHMIAFTCTIQMTHAGRWTYSPSCQSTSTTSLHARWSRRSRGSRCPLCPSRISSR